MLRCQLNPNSFLATLRLHQEPLTSPHSHTFRFNSLTAAMKSFAHTSLPIINAHRGAIYDAVENSLDAFTLGIEQGAKSLELDVVRLASSELVVFHGGGNHENPGEVSHLFSKIEDDLDDDASSSYDPSSPSSYSSTASDASTVPASDPLDAPSSSPPPPTYTDIIPNVYYIEEMTLSQVRRLRFSPNSPGIRPLLYPSLSPHVSASNSANEVESRSLIRNCETAEIPLLSEVLDLCKERGVHIALEMKGQGVEVRSKRGAKRREAIRNNHPSYQPFSRFAHRSMTAYAWLSRPVCFPL